MKDALSTKAATPSGRDTAALVQSDARGALPIVSIVIPVFKESSNLEHLFRQLISAIAPIEKTRWEFIFVNDGSTDNSLEVLRRLADQDERVRIVDLARNFGKEVALSAGVHYASGDAAICMDADLQHPPAVIPQLVSAWRAGAEVVATVRKQIDNQPLVRVIGSHLFYWLMNRFSDVEMISQTTDFRLIDRAVIEAFKKIDEKRRIFRGLIDWLGFKKVWIEFKAPKREAGDPGYSMRKLWNLAFDSFISYSSLPLKLIGWIGFLITVGSALLLGWMLVAKYLVSAEFYYTPLAIFVVANTFLMGIVMTALGLMSLYISKIYSEVQERPLYAVRELINFNKAENTGLH